jgi:hypothetical protein
MRLIIYILIFLLLGCASKNKTTKRYNSKQLTELQLEQLETLRKDIDVLTKKLNTTTLNVRKTTKEGKRTFEPINPDKPSKIITGSDTITLDNAKATFEENEEKSQTNKRDSTFIENNLKDKSELTRNTDLDASNNQSEKGRETDTQVKRTSTFVTIGIGVGIFLILALLGWWLYRRFS